MLDTYEEATLEKKTLRISRKKPEPPSDEGIYVARSGNRRERSSAVYMCFLCCVIILAPKCVSVNIFKVPEAPREVVTKKKVRPPQVPEVVPVKGTCLTVSFHGRARGKTGRLVWIALTQCKLTDVFKETGSPKELAPTEESH